MLCMLFGACIFLERRSIVAAASVKLTHGLSAMKHKLGGSTPAARREVDDLREVSHRLSFYEYCSGVL